MLHSDFFGEKPMFCGWSYIYFFAYCRETPTHGEREREREKKEDEKHYLGVQAFDVMLNIINIQQP